MYNFINISFLSYEDIIKSIVRTRGDEMIIGLVYDSSPFLHKRKRFRVGGIFCEEVFGNLYVCKKHECNVIRFNVYPILRKTCSLCGDIMSYNSLRKYRFGAMLFNFPIFHCFAGKMFSKILKTFTTKSGPNFFLEFMFDPEGTDIGGAYSCVALDFLFCWRFFYFIHLVYDDVSALNVFRVKCDNIKKYSKLRTTKLITLAKFSDNLYLLKKAFILLFPVLPCGLRVHSLDNRKVSLNTKLNDLYNHILETNEQIISGHRYSIKSIFMLNLLVGFLLNFSDLNLIFDDEPTFFSRVQGKEGIFRHNLLGFRVDYSGRATIVPGPSLSLTDVGLPFGVMDNMLNIYGSSVCSKKFTRDLNKASGCEAVIYKHYVKNRMFSFSQLHKVSVIINRAPTLHKMNIQAFNPVFTEGEVVKFMPLLCAGYNADFDGDQMGVFNILSRSSVIEAAYMLRPSVNLYSPTTKKTLLSPTQGALSGSYMLANYNYFVGPVCYIFEDYSAIIEAVNNNYIDADCPVFCRGLGGVFSLNSFGRLLFSR